MAWVRERDPPWPVRVGGPATWANTAAHSSVNRLERLGEQRERKRERAKEREKKPEAAFVDGAHKRKRHELNKRLAFNPLTWRLLLVV